MPRGKMLSRGFEDALSVWPVVVWPVLASSLFWAFLQICRASEARYGFSVLNRSPRSELLAGWVYVPLGAAVEATMHLYLLWVMGPAYLFAPLPIFILGWWLVPTLAEDIAPAQIALPMLHLCTVAALAVLLGFADIPILRAANQQVYSLLAGVPVTL